MSQIATSVFEADGKKIVEVTGDGILIRSVGDALQILMDVAFSGSNKIILHQKNFTPEFFDLKTRMAGEILQKVSNYRLQLAIVGDFTDVKSESLRAFILESNRGKQSFFVNDVGSARSLLLKTDL